MDILPNRPNWTTTATLAWTSLTLLAINQLVELASPILAAVLAVLYACITLALLISAVYNLRQVVLAHRSRALEAEVLKPSP